MGCHQGIVGQAKDLYTDIATFCKVHFSGEPAIGGVGVDQEILDQALAVFVIRFIDRWVIVDHDDGLGLLCHTFPYFGKDTHLIFPCLGEYDLGLVAILQENLCPFGQDPFGGFGKGVADVHKNGGFPNEDLA